MNTSILEQYSDFFKDEYYDSFSDSDSYVSSLDYGDDNESNYDMPESPATEQKNTKSKNIDESKPKRKYVRKSDNSHEPSLLCYICGKMLGDVYRYEDHFRMHFPEKCLKCRFCDKLFAIAANRKIHEKLHSEGIYYIVFQIKRKL